MEVNHVTRFSPSAKVTNYESRDIGKGQFSLCILKRYKLIIKKRLKIPKG